MKNFFWTGDAVRWLISTDPKTWEDIDLSLEELTLEQNKRVHGILDHVKTRLGTDPGIPEVLSLSLAAAEAVDSCDRELFEAMEFLTGFPSSPVI